jgi:putative SOS response-associated peptidase YedK
MPSINNLCGRFVTIIPYEELKRIFDLVEGETTFLEPRYNAAPTQTVAVVRSAGEHNALVPMSWGLVPSWSQDTTIASHTINARSETVAEKPSDNVAYYYYGGYLNREGSIFLPASRWIEARIITI